MAKIIGIDLGTTVTYAMKHSRHPTLQKKDSCAIPDGAHSLHGFRNREGCTELKIAEIKGFLKGKGLGIFRYFANIQQHGNLLA